MTHNELAAGLRELADFYETHPEAPLPYPALFLHLYDKPSFLKAALGLSKGGKVKKYIHNLLGDNSSTEYRVARTFGPITVTVSIDRNRVCKLVQPAVYDCPDSLLAEEAAEFAGVE